MHYEVPACRRDGRPTVEGLRKLPEPAATMVPQDPVMLARFNAGVQIGGGLLLASGKMPRVASAALACTVVPGSLGGHLFWTESDPERKAQLRRDFLTDLSLIGGLISRRSTPRASPHWVARATGGSACIPGGVGGAAGRRRVGGRCWRRRRKSRHACTQVPNAAVSLPRSPVSVLARCSRSARERGAELAEVARERGSELAEVARNAAQSWPAWPSNAAPSSPTPRGSAASIGRRPPRSGRTPRRRQSSAPRRPRRRLRSGFARSSPERPTLTTALSR